MGEVYRARDTRLDRDVAIKVLPDTFAADPDRLSRFEREARAVAALSHPGILAIHDFGRADGLTYAVMELLEGSTLRARLDSAPLAPRRAIDVAGQIVRALGAAHEKGIVHRDIKPENIFITTDGHVKILDFGLARLVASPIGTLAAAGTRTRVETGDGVVLGTVGYMSPEQVRGVAADHRSDSEIVARHIEVVREGERQPQDVTLFEQSTAGAISTDGSSVLITDQGSYAGTEYAAYLRRLAEPAAVKLGDGQGFEFAHDMKWVLSLVYGPPSRILLLPVGAGETKQLPNPDGLTILAVAFLPDHKHVVYLGSAGNGPLRGYIQGIEDGARQPFTAEGVHVNTATFWRMPVAPDGSGVALIGGDGRIYAFPTNAASQNR